MLSRTGWQHWPSLEGVAGCPDQLRPGSLWRDEALRQEHSIPSILWEAGFCSAGKKPPSKACFLGQASGASRPLSNIELSESGSTRLSHHNPHAPHCFPSESSPSAPLSVDFYSPFLSSSTSCLLAPERSPLLCASSQPASSPSSTLEPLLGLAGDGSGSGCHWASAKWNPSSWRPDSEHFVYWKQAQLPGQ